MDDRKKLMIGLGIIIGVTLILTSYNYIDDLENRKLCEGEGYGYDSDERFEWIDGELYVVCLKEVSTSIDNEKQLETIYVKQK